MMMDKPHEVIADSSFYICFLDDIEKPDTLVRMLDEFDFIVPPIVHDEINKSKNYCYISNHSRLELYLSPFDYGAVLSPFFSKEEIVKGEHQVIAVAHILYEEGDKICVILDDDSPRKFISNNFQHLISFLTYTLNFLQNCCCEYCILTKEEAELTLDLIEKSKFRVKPSIIHQVRGRIRAS